MRSVNPIHPAPPIASRTRWAPSAPISLATEVAVFANCSAGHGCPVAAHLDQTIQAIQAAGGRLVNDPRDRSLGEQLKSELETTPRLIIAIGGDGTVNASAQKAIRADAALLILPHGTMNLVARDLQLPVDPQAVLDTAAELSTLEIDYATVNGHLFLHSALIGLVPEMAVVRERIRGAQGLLAIARHVPDFVRSAFYSNPIEVKLQAGTKAARGRSRSVVVTTNPLADTGQGLYARESLAGGRLGVYTSDHNGPFAPLKLLLSLGPGRLPRDPETLAASCESLLIHTRRPTITVSVDGEVRRLKTPLEFKIHPRGLRAAVPTTRAGAVAL